MSFSVYLPQVNVAAYFIIFMAFKIIFCWLVIRVVVYVLITVLRKNCVQTCFDVTKAASGAEPPPLPNVVLLRLIMSCGWSQIIRNFSINLFLLMLLFRACSYCRSLLCSVWSYFQRTNSYYAVLSWYRVGQKEPVYCCNIFVRCQPTFVFLAHVHYRKFANGGSIVSPPNIVYVTALPCKILMTTLAKCVYMFTTINNKYQKICTR